MTNGTRHDTAILTWQYFALPVLLAGVRAPRAVLISLVVPPNKARLPAAIFPSAVVLSPEAATARRVRLPPVTRRRLPG